MTRIQFGSGGHRIDGWVNTEIDTVDIRNPLPYADASVDALAASHVLEHVASPEAMRFLQECHRVLRPAGWLRLSVPVIGPWLGRQHVIDLAVSHGHLCTYDEHTLRTLLWAAGFDDVQRVDRDLVLDGHHKVIGEELDSRESCRLVATKGFK